MSRPQPDLPALDVERTAGLWARLEGVLASGRWTPTQGMLRHETGAYPVLAQRGLGGRMWDTSGAEYVDWMMGWGPVVLGHRHPVVEDAIRRQLAEGTLMSLTHPLEIEVAEAVRAMVPCADGVAFGKNGSDVLGLAVRIARAHTGRELVLYHGYHGFHDWYMAGIPQCKGMPESLRDTVQEFPFNDPEALAQALARNAGKVAAIVLEPAREQEPAPGYLARVRELADAYGAVLVFDEILTSFRLAKGGAQELYGVVPDLATVGKALANGMPLSALCGRARFLHSIVHVGYGLTYRGELLSLAAAKATLEVIRTEPVVERLRATGERLRRGFAVAAARHGVAARLSGPSPRLQIDMGDHGRMSALAQASLLIQECLKRGVLTNGAFNPCYAHEDRDIELTLAAFEAAFATLAQAREAGSLRGFLTTPGVAIKYGDEEALR